MHEINFIVIIVFSVIVGSFLNVIIYRTPIVLHRRWQTTNTENDHHPFTSLLSRSCCPHCHRVIAWWHNVPLLSYIWLKGLCAYCHDPISWRYPLVEICAGLIAVTAYIFFPLDISLVGVLAAGWILLALAAIDLRDGLLPDELTMPLLWLGLALNATHLYTTPDMAILGAMGGYGVLWLCAIAFRFITKKDGIGAGDLKLCAAIGAWVGLPAVPAVILIFSWMGLVYGILYLLLTRQNKNTPFPLGPWIALAGWIVVLGKDNIMHWLNING